jgi:hypothetical protein
MWNDDDHADVFTSVDNNNNTNLASNYTNGVVEDEAHTPPNFKHVC